MSKKREGLEELIQYCKNDREKTILFNIIHNQTYEMTGNIFKISRQRIEQIIDSLEKRKEKVNKAIYKVLTKEMIVRKISLNVLSSALQIESDTISNKLHHKNNKYDFTVSEKYFIQHTFFPDIPVNELFAK